MNNNYLLVITGVLLISVLASALSIQEEKIKPFSIPHLSQEQISELKHRIQSAVPVLPDQLTDVEDAWEYGTNVHYLKQLIQYWHDEYDWNNQVDTINKELPQYTTEIDGINVHFAHVRSQRTNAYPLLMVHGWPGSFYECIKVAKMYANPSSDQPAFHVVCPSLPGYGFSSAATTSGMTPEKIAAIFMQLMDRLGYTEYMAQGGDWGSIISQKIAVFDRHCKGLHLNFCMPDPKGVANGVFGIAKRVIQILLPSWFFSKEEIADWPETKNYVTKQLGYSIIQGTKPQTIGYALTDSPVGLAAYIIEKFHAWSDNFEKFSKDELLTNVMIYYTSRSITSSMRLYYETMHNKNQTDVTYIATPTACAVFRKELVKPPKSWLESAWNLVHYTRMPRGGHFAALEEPELLVKDVQSFYQNNIQQKSSGTSNKNEL